MNDVMDYGSDVRLQIYNLNHDFETLDWRVMSDIHLALMEFPLEGVFSDSVVPFCEQWTPFR